jgi:nitrite reductase/ring-hydroxylating ferredoxin subunit
MRTICRLEDIPDAAAKGFTVPDGKGIREIFIVRKQGHVYGYINSCPHLGTPLEFLPDRFLTADGQEILCSTHGARFETTTGRCVAGPCRGRFLKPEPLCIDGGMIVLAKA